MSDPTRKYNSSYSRTPIGNERTRPTSPIKRTNKAMDFDQMLENLTELEKNPVPSIQDYARTDRNEPKSPRSESGRNSPRFNRMRNPRKSEDRKPIIDFNSLETSLAQLESESAKSTGDLYVKPKALDSSFWKTNAESLFSNFKNTFPVKDPIKDLDSLYSKTVASVDSRILEDEITEKERLEMEKSRTELMKLNAEKKRADRAEAEMVARTREQRLLNEKRQMDGKNLSVPLLMEGDVDERILVVEYLNALMTSIRNDKKPSPVPEDFLTMDSFAQWKSTMKRSLQEILVKMIKARHVNPPEVNAEPETVEMRLTIIEAQGLVAKPGQSRSAYCTIEDGDLKQKSKDVFQTDKIEDTTTPRWNQSMVIEIRSLTHFLLIQVKDSKKDQFLGELKFPMSELVGKVAKGRYERWFELQPRGGKQKDKYVGGRLKISLVLLDSKGDNQKQKTYGQMQSTLNSFNLDNRALYEILMRGCLVLDLYSLEGEDRDDLLSEESVCILKLWSKTWNISIPFQIISYMKILFEKYREDSVSVSEVLKAFHLMYSHVKRKGGFSSFEMDASIDLLEKMKSHCSNAVLNYKELFPENLPRGELEATILVLRMIHKFPTFLDRHPDLPSSHRDALKIMMTEACITKFQQFKELTAPMNENDPQSLIAGINTLANMVNDEIDKDLRYYRPAFAQELDIVRLTAESQLKYFVLSLEDISDLLGADDTVQNASQQVFELYKIIRSMGQRFSDSVPGLSSLSIDYIESWFAPFMYKWLDNLAKRTTGWVEEAIKADSFTVLENANSDLAHSSSVTDVFSAIYAKLEFITELQWSDPVQNAQFLQGFAKTMNAAIELYCDAVYEKETQSTVAALTQMLRPTTNDSPKDVDVASCVKLRNIGFALSKVRELYRMMNVATITKTVLTHRKSMAVLNKKEEETDKICGQFKFTICFAENVKPTSKNGSSSPYVVVRVPEGTVQPPDEHQRARTDADKNGLAPVVLTGPSCEKLRSRYIKDSLNPTWDETFSVILPPVERLEVAIFSKNILSADEVAGTAIIDLSRGTKLRTKLADHLIHDVYIELEPQGRLLLRISQEGEEEDVEFWFKRTNERLIRTRDSLLRSLTDRIEPYISQMLGKAVSDNEPAVIPSTSFLSSFTAPVKYSDKNAAGIPITKQVTEDEILDTLGPLFDYLEKNFETLCDNLMPSMSKVAIGRLWTHCLVILTNLLVPQLFGVFTQKYLNPRQLSVVSRSVEALKNFFYCDGEELGLPIKELESAVYWDLMDLISFYEIDLAGLKFEYETSLRKRKDKELILRLVRLRSDGPDGNTWIEAQLKKRRDKQ